MRKIRSRQRGTAEGQQKDVMRERAEVKRTGGGKRWKKETVKSEGGGERSKQREGMLSER